jgi:hypothetical protein
MGQQQLESCHLFTKGARRLLDTDVNQLKEPLSIRSASSSLVVPELG